MLAVAGWWVVRAPARVEPAPPAVVDSDPPALRARRDAAVALAVTPDDPWTFAESLAASAPAKEPEKEPEKERCGNDQRPQFGEPQEGQATPQQVKAAGPDYLKARARVDAALRASADPFDSAVADFLNIGDMRTPAGRLDALVQQAASTTDARVYGLAYTACQAARSRAPDAVRASTEATSCDALSARQWARIDAGNGVPWLWALQAAVVAGDAGGRQDALAHLATSTRFDDRQHAAAGAVAAQVPGNESNLAAVTDLAGQAFAGQSSAPNPMLALCVPRRGADATLAGLCTSAATTMFEHADSLALRAQAGGLLYQLTGDASRRDAARAERELAVLHWSLATGFSECGTERDKLKIMLRSARMGEVEAMREQARIFMPP